MANANNDHSYVDMFGLTYEQSLLMFSTQRLIAERDKNHTKGEKNQNIKSQWITEWEKGIITYLKHSSNKSDVRLLSGTEIFEGFKRELNNSNNRTWYYIVALELLEFVPFTPLGSENDKQYSKCKFDNKYADEYVMSMLLSHNFLTKDTIEKLQNSFTKSISHISGKKTGTKIVIVLAIGFLGLGLTALGAPHIAVALFGSKMAGLGGAALVNACLALAGGGAIAAGGLGIAGGTCVIAGGGALLGLAAGGTAVGVASSILSAPDYTLTQAAKLETILKEVVIVAQQDVVNAQKIINEYKEQINELNRKLVEMEMEQKKDKEEIKNIKKSIEYLMKSCSDMKAFADDYVSATENKDNV